MISLFAEGERWCSGSEFLRGRRGVVVSLFAEGERWCSGFISGGVVVPLGYVLLK